jgi:hypothetical protein
MQSPGSTYFLSQCVHHDLYEIGPMLEPGNPYRRRRRVSTVDLPVLTSSEQLVLRLKNHLCSEQGRYLNEEVKRTEPSPSLRVPGLEPVLMKKFYNMSTRSKDTTMSPFMAV